MARQLAKAGGLVAMPHNADADLSAPGLGNSDPVAHLPVLIPAADVAKTIGYSVKWLEADRAKEAPAIPFCRIGGRTIRYRRSDVRAFIEAARPEAA